MVGNYCHYCLHGFSRKIYSKNISQLFSPWPQKLVFPKKEGTNGCISKLMPRGWKFLCDLCRLWMLHWKIILVNKSRLSSTTLYQKHTPLGFFVVVSSALIQPSAVVYRGERHRCFYWKLLEAEKDIVSILSKVKPMNLSPAEECSFQGLRIVTFVTNLLEQTVWDHDHLTGQFRGQPTTGAIWTSSLGRKMKEAHPISSCHLPQPARYDSHLIAVFR